MRSEKFIPNLFIPGAGKSGTSSLHEYLNQHPDIFMSPVKEPHFFSKHYSDADFGNAWDNYLELYKEGVGAKYRGESSTGYMVFPNVIERIKQNIWNPKFIFLLRNPIDRAFSHYNWVRSFGKEDRFFKDAILSDKDEEPDISNNFGQGYKYYFQFGLYGKWINRFYSHFDTDQIMIITAEQLKKNPLGTLNTCYSFLNLSQVSSCDMVNSNKTRYYTDPAGFIRLRNYWNLSWIPVEFRAKAPEQLRDIYRKIKKNIISRTEKKFIAKAPPALDTEERTWLKDLYEPDVEALMRLTGQNFTEWQYFEQNEIRINA